MASKNDALDLTILAHMEGLDGALKSVQNALNALSQVQDALANISVTMDVDDNG
ncbi:hypothetical protein SEA_DUSTYDINO_11 [Microbacterium phage DustyDino]|nr:hypothetical protein SEA_DUSTYDINO_11 [Microbacterium phage DustyDino]